MKNYSPNSRNTTLHLKLFCTYIFSTKYLMQISGQQDFMSPVFSETLNKNPDKLIVEPKKALKSKFAVFTLNVQCLRNKMTEFEVCVDSLRPDLICISEHWLQQGEINNYTLATHLCRTNKIHGGLLIYTKKFILFRTITNINSLTAEQDCEICTIESIQT